MKALKILLAMVILLGSVLALNACQSLGSPLEDYNWILTRWTDMGEEVSLVPGVQMTAYFNSKDKTVNGTGGCNQYSVAYTVDGLSLTIGHDIAMTEMFCSDEINTQEWQYIDTLRNATSFKIDHGNLILYCGNEMLQFRREDGTPPTITQWGQ